MKLSRLEREEVISVIGGVVLAIGLFLSWYTLGNDNANIGPFDANETKGVTGFDALQIMRYILLVGAAAPLVLAYIVMRGHALTWPRGELTAVVAVTVLTLVVVRGVIVRPGDPPGQIGLGEGWFISLAGAIIMFGGAAFHRARHDSSDQKPPGVL